MEMIVDFPGGARVDAHFGPFTVPSDQPPQDGGQNLAPSPFETFLASIGACAGVYVLGFCRQRGLPTEGIRLVESINANPLTGMIEKIGLTVELPPEFPEKYKAAVIRAADHCTVKRHLEHPPTVEIVTAESHATPA
jgi:putative redox protein